MQAYSDPKREYDPHALPDINIWYVSKAEANRNAAELSISDEREGMIQDEPGFYWWSCFPGCLSGGEASGPYKSEQEALKAAREAGGLCEHGIPEDERCDECPALELWVIQGANGTFLHSAMLPALRMSSSCAAYCTKEAAEQEAARFPRGGLTVRRLTDEESRVWQYGEALADARKGSE